MTWQQGLLTLCGLTLAVLGIGCFIAGLYRDAKAHRRIMGAPNHSTVRDCFQDFKQSRN